MKNAKTRFLALFSSFGALLGTCGGACGVACVAGGCCGSTALFGFIGLSGSTMQFFEKLTPLFLVITIASLAYAFYQAYKPSNASCCDVDSNASSEACCASQPKQSFFRSKSFLWAITVFSVIMWTYPYFSKHNSNQNACGSSVSVTGKGSENDGLLDSACCEQASSCSTVCEP